MQERKRLAARELIAESWREGSLAGIEPELLAEEMMLAVLDELANARGTADATELAGRFLRMVREGRLISPNLLH